MNRKRFAAYAAVTTLVVVGMGGLWLRIPRPPPAAPPPPPVAATAPTPAAAEAPFVEPPLEDKGPAPAAGAPWRIAYIEEGSEPNRNARSYALDLKPWLCEGKTVPEWLQPGSPIWLYAPDGIAKGKVGSPSVSREELNGIEICFASAPIGELRSRRDYLVAAPQGHGTIPATTARQTTSDDELAVWPPAIVERVKAVWRRFPEGDHRIAGMWVLAGSGAPTFYSAFVSGMKHEGGGETFWEEAEQGRLAPGAGTASRITGDCTRGALKGLVDVDGDGAPEGVFEVAQYEMPSFHYFCEWQGAHWKLVEPADAKRYVHRTD